MKHILSLALLLGGFLVFSVGCGEPKLTNVTENADDAALAEYEALLEADNKAMETDPSDAE